MSYLTDGDAVGRMLFTLAVAVFLAAVFEAFRPMKQTISNFEIVLVVFYFIAAFGAPIYVLALGIPR